MAASFLTWTEARQIDASEEFIADYLERRIDFFKLKHVFGKSFERIDIDAPGWLAKRICKLSRGSIPELIDIITAPTLRPDGSLLGKPGYDPDTKLLLLPGEYPDIPRDPSIADVKAAWEILWYPFFKFPFVSADDRATAIACALTATVRKILPRAPGFNFDAAMASSGKTLLAGVSQELAGSGFVTPWTNDTEFRKTITAVLRDGYPTLLLDNIRGHVDSPAMEAFLTSETWCDRVLTTSTMFNGPSKILFLFSGNNFQPGRDLWRRVLNCRIDPKRSDPHKRSFDFCPRTHARQNRQKIVAAALTILRGFLCHGASRKTSDRLGSFEEWDDLVRQCVIWLGMEKMDNTALLGDPSPRLKRRRRTTRRHNAWTLSCELFSPRIPGLVYSKRADREGRVYNRGKI